MPTTRTPRAALQLPATADRGWDAGMNGNTNALDGTNAVGWLCVTQSEYPSASLNVNVSLGDFVSAAGVYVLYPGVLGYAVPANAITYLWVTDAGVLASGTGWPTSGTNHVRLAKVSAGATTLNFVTDQRTPWRSASS